MQFGQTLDDRFICMAKYEKEIQLLVPLKNVKGGIISLELAI